MTIENYRRKAAAFMNAAAATDDPARRRSLMNEVVYWHTLALEAEANPGFRLVAPAVAVAADAR